MNTEIEARFLNIDKQGLIEHLHILGATDHGEKMLSEVIFYDIDRTWQQQGRFVRLRTTSDKTVLTYKQNREQTIDSAKEIEFTISDPHSVEQLLTILGLEAFRHQEKKRHTFVLGEVTIDIDSWPQIPSYVELEGPSTEAVKNTAMQLGFDWNDAVFNDALQIIQNHYNVPVGIYRWFTFDKSE